MSEYDEVVQKYIEANYSSRKIAGLLGLSQSRVLRICKGLGIKSRAKSGPPPQKGQSERLGFCLWCGQKVKRYFCHRTSCRQDYNNHIYINKWYLGLADGGSVSHKDVLRRPIRAHLLRRANNKCTLCGWSEKNIYSDTYPLIVDHISGVVLDHSPENLRVICPNCDSLTPTYKGLNIGQGRDSRYKL